jgi:hypothetical protein
MASRQHNAQFHKSKTLDNKYVSALAPPASRLGSGGNSWFARPDFFGGALLALTVFSRARVQMLGDEIGKGAYGRVYKGLDLENGDFVAIKQVSLENIPQEDLNIIMVSFHYFGLYCHAYQVPTSKFVELHEMWFCCAV